MTQLHNHYDELISLYKEYSVLGTVSGLLHWDMQVMMAPKGANRRAEQLALISGLAHEKLTSPRIGELIEKLSGSGNGFTPDQLANLREIDRDYKLATKIPKELVEELTRAESLAHEVWVKARENNDFELFAPHLEKLVQLVCRKADYLGFTEVRYDALVDQFEPQGTTAMFSKLFDEVKAVTIPLVEKVVSSRVKADHRIFDQDFPVDKQREFGSIVMKQLGFDTQAGRLDTSVHPFCSGGKGDIRITTRYNPRAPQQALFGVIHETGHALYEQEVNPDYLFTPLSDALSMGMHESQSRMWENFIGRGRPFWTYFFPIFQNTFPEQTKAVTLDQFLVAVNDVRKSLVRVEADELTYDLHIILRFELERDLISGSLSVSDLPAAWNKKFEAYFGMTPPNVGKEGVMQDVHWSSGAFGYFPSYSLGNMVAGQLWKAMGKDIPGLEKKFEVGKFGETLDWLRTNVHLMGRKLTRDELLIRATGSPLSTSHYLEYLRLKFSELYNF